MTARAYAKEFFRNPPQSDDCPGCGLSYVKGSPDDERLHRAYHRGIVETFAPPPNPALAKQYAQHGPFVPLVLRSPLWLHERLYRIARALQRENGYDFAMWSAAGDDGDGFVFTDARGRALGGCAVRWREWEDAPPGWVLQWIWIAPPYRRQGLLREAWAMLTGRYPGIIPEPPFSPAAASFFQQCDGLPEVIKARIDHSLRADPDCP